MSTARGWLVSAGLMLCITIAGTALLAQSPTFDVASVKPNLSGTNMVNFGWAGGRFTAENASLRMLISLAFGDGAPLPQNRIVVNEQWMGDGSYLSSEHFDIIAKTDGDPAREQLP